ncbi:hypothetical protein MLD38_038512 [Melastoma candidum]|uniref:Uncharacterized protein n=1 Tax=Melastoma candidum TaxID=119954 RepID=A0ACB9KZ49_9MYRT|nr:hypothetical protein MLD38_038512 [Melastoma candidum]
MSASLMNLVLFLLYLASIPSCINARLIPRRVLNSSHVSSVEEDEEEDLSWLAMKRFLGAGARRRCTVPGLSQVKLYFHRFGYYVLRDGTRFNHDDDLDFRFKNAILQCEAKQGHPLTRERDLEAPTKFASPRGSLPEMVSRVHATERYLYFPGKPRWSSREPMVLTYAFSPEHSIDYLSQKEIRSAFRHAFSRWSSVIPMNFEEAGDYAYADIKIGFYGGDHGDGQPFDGVLGILAHSFSPESGRFHLDKAERWAVDFDTEQSRVAVDLESVAVHEIGHLLGLEHSQAKDAVMYPSLMPRERRVDLKADDIDGVQALYGSRHKKVMFGSMLRSDDGPSSNGASPQTRPPVLLGHQHLHIMLILLLLTT